MSLTGLKNSKIVLGGRRTKKPAAIAAGFVLQMMANNGKTLKQTFCFTEYTFGSLKTIQIDLWQKIMETVASKVGVEEEKHLILHTLNDYLQGRPIKDIEKLRGAFHSDAYIRTIIEGKLVQWTLPQYLDLVAQATL